MPASLPHVLVLVGPTASGKTEVSIGLARALNAEIISADSRQVYRYLDIGTAKPAPEQLSAVRHYFIDEKLPNEPFSAGEFGVRGRKVVDGILASGKVPLIVGGSGLYIQSLIDGLFEGPAADPEIRQILEAKVARGMIPDLIEELRRVDPDRGMHADPAKPRRIIRALEVYYLTGKPLSAHHRENKPEIRFQPLIFGLAWDRGDLYERIDRRCDAMISSGLEQETKHLREVGYDRTINALNTVGYAEIFAFQNGEISRDEMVRLFKQNSRRYAKRQMTWFRRDPRIHWIAMNAERGPETAAAEILHVSQNTARQSKPLPPGLTDNSRNGKTP
jgi:tRNA dimethylallyltransferase